MRRVGFVVALAGLVGCGGGGFVVGGAVEGLWDGDAVQLRLAYGDRTELLDVAADGDFRFAAEVGDGEGFEVTVAGGAPCQVGDGAGVIAGADVTTVAVRCGAAVDVELAVPFAWTFDPVPTRSEVDVSILMQELGVTVIAPGMQITIDGTPATSGAELLVTVAPGEDVVAIDLTDGSRHRRYELLVRRGARTLAEALRFNAGIPLPYPDLGQSVALSRDHGLAGAPSHDLPNTDSGALRPLQRTATGWQVDDWIGTDTPSTYAFVGFSMAIDGDRLAVGADRENGANLTQGAVYVFERSPQGWGQVARVQASNAGFGDKFGTSVALSGDTLVVGARDEDSNATGIDGDPADNSATDSGAVYVFERATDGTWNQAAYVKALTRAQAFGLSVALDGDVMAVGSAGELVYVFRRTAGTWAQEDVLRATTPFQFQLFGGTVAVAGDRIAVGTPWDNGIGPGVDGDPTQTGPVQSGAVYVFRHQAGAWVEEAYLKARLPTDSAGVGWALAMVGDVLVAGASGDASASTGIDGDASNRALQNAGAAHVFHRVGDQWFADAYVKPSITANLAQFGGSVALSTRGLACGAMRDPTGGSVFLFE